ncbi:Cys-tRNA(Pro) deacylase [Schaalia vaccimaxillae]|uniref:Cys-tRNA(Pro) deacylase n=1 Tax=Schaalia vaccimaxillae TaxID=183916 RepID=UPI0003B78F55|nr:Cys-tRNA(Pro) deacylase [Schaalia vaccimaxillae]
MGKHRSTDHTGGATRAIEALTAAGVTFTIHEYEHSSDARFFGEETVAKLGVDPARTFKTLMVRLNTGEFVIGCIPVLEHLSMKLIAHAAGAKNAQMAEPAVAQRRTGYVVGGISPLGQTTEHRTFVDESCLDHETMLVSGGRRGLSVELSPLDLIELAGAEVADLKAQEWRY